MIRRSADAGSVNQWRVFVLQGIVMMKGQIYAVWKHME